MSMFANPMAMMGKGLSAAGSMGNGLAMPVEPPPAAPRRKFDFGRFALDTIINLGASQGNPVAINTLRNRSAQEEYERRMAAEREAAQAARFAPQKVGDSIVQLDPQTGQYRAVYSAPAAATPTAMERNFEFLKTIDPALADSYVRSQGDPIQLIREDHGDGRVTMHPFRRGSGTLGGGPAPGRPPVGSVITTDPRQGGAPQAGARGFRP